MNRLLALAAALALVSTSAVAATGTPAKAPKAQTAQPRCFVRVNQPAASVRLNRTSVPASVCVQSCEAALVGAHRESGQVVALAIYTGKHCR